MSTFLASHSYKSLLQDTTVKVAVDEMSNIGPEKAALPFKTIFINLLKCLEIIFNTPIILGVM